jgi:hypothetical protein
VTLGPLQIWKQSRVLTFRGLGASQVIILAVQLTVGCSSYKNAVKVYPIRRQMKPGAVAHACNSSYWVAEFWRIMSLGQTPSQPITGSSGTCLSSHLHGKHKQEDQSPGPLGQNVRYFSKSNYKSKKGWRGRVCGLSSGAPAEQVWGPEFNYHKKKRKKEKKKVDEKSPNIILDHFLFLLEEVSECWPLLMKWWAISKEFCPETTWLAPAIVSLAFRVLAYHLGVPNISTPWRKTI